MDYFSYSQLTSDLGDLLAKAGKALKTGDAEGALLSAVDGVSRIALAPGTADKISALPTFGEKVAALWEGYAGEAALWSIGHLALHGQYENAAGHLYNSAILDTPFTTAKGHLSHAVLWAFALQVYAGDFVWRDFAALLVPGDEALRDVEPESWPELGWQSVEMKKRLVNGRFFHPSVDVPVTGAQGVRRMVAAANAGLDAVTSLENQDWCNFTSSGAFQAGAGNQPTLAFFPLI